MLLNPLMDHETLRVLIAEDHGPTRVQLRAFLESQSINVCGEAADGKEAIAKVQELNPSLVILDIYMPNVGGVAAAYEIRRIAPSTKSFSLRTTTLRSWRLLVRLAAMPTSQSLKELSRCSLRLRSS